MTMHYKMFVIDREGGTEYVHSASVFKYQLGPEGFVDFETDLGGTCRMYGNVSLLPALTNNPESEET